MTTAARSLEMAAPEPGCGLLCSCGCGQPCACGVTLSCPDLRSHVTEAGARPCAAHHDGGAWIPCDPDGCDYALGHFCPHEGEGRGWWSRVPGDDSHVTDVSQLWRAEALYAELGFYTLTLDPRRKAVPTGMRIADAATLDLNTIARRRRRRPAGNVAIACEPSGVVVVDIEGADGLATIAALERLHGALPRTPTLTTARGHHLWFHRPDDLELQPGLVGPGLRIVTGYAVAPPSMHPTGALYAWVSDRRIDELDLAPLPPWLARLAVQGDPA